MPSTTDEIRELFLRFFEERGHLRLPSSSLVPVGDPTLLLTTAGMVQVKPYFTGEAVPPNPRLTSCQKCFRTTDIDSVGDDKHLTFFEMLGNFSVGDYFKKEAIAWAWEFVTQKLAMPKDRLWITVFLDDDEAFAHWRALGVPESRILRYGEKDNFWGPAGDSGPCGPSSEIHYDWGEEYGCGPGCEPAHPCGRFLEIWNLVFTQFDQAVGATRRVALPRPNIDTGMGLERTVSVVTGKHSFYDTEVFQPLLGLVSKLAGVPLRPFDSAQGRQAQDKALRTIVEHSRGIAFLLADGVVPSNEGRGYVLRRVLRRAVRFGWLLGLKEPFLGKMVEAVIGQMGHVYPELVRQREFILRMVEHEEQRFRNAVKRGTDILEGYIAGLKTVSENDIEKVREALAPALGAQDPLTVKLSLLQVRGVLSALWGQVDAARETMERGAMDKCGDYELSYSLACSDIRQALIALQNADAQMIQEEFTGFLRVVRTIPCGRVFVLYDTFGFPAELTEEIAKEHGLSVDMAGFRAEMERQRERARAAHRFAKGDKAKSYEELGIESTPFLGYETTEATSTVVAVLVNGEPVEVAEQGQEVEVILRESPFYAEMGGQVGDTGVLKGEHGQVQVTDTVHAANGLIVHRGRVSQGRLAVNDGVVASVDAEQRYDIMRNHTATHLLQAALRQVIGSHVRQTGSLVAPDRLRFDYSHLLAPSPEELREAERLVNENIRRNLPVQPRQVPYRQALEEGAIALFDEKYGDTVRLVEIKGPEGRVSAELCGGTHCSATGEIGLFHITSEASIGSGMRRIEAVTGRGAETLVRERFAALEAAARSLKAPVAEFEARLASLVEELARKSRFVGTLERELARRALEPVVKRKLRVAAEKRVVAGRVEASSMDTLRQTGDWVRDKLGSAIIVLASVIDGRPQFMAMVTPDLVEKGYHAGEIVKRVAAIAGGGGGGRAELAQAGGKDPSKIEDALRQVPEIVRASVVRRKEGNVRAKEN